MANTKRQKKPVVQQRTADVGNEAMPASEIYSLLDSIDALLETNDNRVARLREKVSPILADPLARGVEGDPVADCDSDVARRLNNIYLALQAQASELDELMDRVRV